MSRSVFLGKPLIAYINKIYCFIENTSKMTFPEKNRIYIFYFIVSYLRRAISTQTNLKNGLIEKKISYTASLITRKKYRIYKLYFTFKNETEVIVSQKACMYGIFFY